MRYCRTINRNGNISAIYVPSGFAPTPTSTPQILHFASADQSFLAEPTRWKQIEMAAKKPQTEIQWMAAPQAPIGCPPGLEYLAQIDQLLVQQQVELLECQLS